MAIGTVEALGWANTFGGAGLLGRLDEAAGAELLCWLKALGGAEGFPNTLVG